MKMKKWFFTAIVALFILLANAGFTQDPPPPPPGGGHGLPGNQAPPGGGVPVGSGLIILMALGAAYGGRKIYQIRSN